MGIRNYWRHVVIGIWVVATAGLILDKFNASIAEPTARAAPLVCATPKPVVDQALLARATESIEASHPKLSAARKVVVASMLTEIAQQVFDTPEYRDYWIALIGVESRYEGTAKSSSGAIGLGQLIPAYKADFGTDCQLTDVNASDLSDDHTNALLSACYFRSLIKMNKGNVPLALVSYNSGPYSKSYDSAKRGGNANAESSGYVTRIMIKKETKK